MALFSTESISGGINLNVLGGIYFSLFYHLKPEQIGKSQIRLWFNNIDLSYLRDTYSI
jgi:hypothetical protein